ncbi:hypothetical protein M0D21_21500 [Aquimarina sp. D1M17]|uniref:hypothetical protein n=1 Tax=Aquimarina acroporae TaxID=2937283 RepID=UPI0020BDFF59|nr:hypothetical protein [Aquimarina acroporae]MCK8524168.1 hypothetical protein [Aquimarina acroporae]
MRDLTNSELSHVNGGTEVSGQALVATAVAVAATAATGVGAVGIAVILINAAIEIYDN